MRLHDLQVVISASNVATKYQNVYQHQGQDAQDHGALQIKQETELKKNQVQELDEEHTTTAMEEKKDNSRQWKRQDFRKKKDRDEMYKLNIPKKDQELKLDPNHIIDIKA